MVKKDTTTQRDKVIRCLDKGFVRLVDVMGDDSSVVQAARVSYGKGTKTRNADRALIHYLMKHDHTSPFEMVVFKFHCKMPIFVARQWVRHRTASINEISGRYTIMKNEFWLPSIDDMRKQDIINRQCSTNQLISTEDAKQTLETFYIDQQTLYSHYEEAMQRGVAREVARTNLPLSLYTEWYWKMDLNNLFRFLKLRLDLHAQKEIRVYAQAIAEFVKEKCPLCWEAFEEHVLFALKLSRTEKEIIKTVLNRHNAFEEVTEQLRQKLRKYGIPDHKIEKVTNTLIEGFNNKEFDPTR